MSSARPRHLELSFKDGGEVEGGSAPITAGLSHLGDGPGTAAPGVQHDCVLVPFLQHFILKSKTRSSGRHWASATELLNSPPNPHHSGWTTSPGGLIRNAVSGPSPGTGDQNLHFHNLPSDSHCQTHSKFEKHWPISPIRYPGALWVSRPPFSTAGRSP